MKRTVALTSFYLGVGLAALGATAGAAASGPLAGEAVVAARVGQAEARLFAGPVHEGRTELVALDEGRSLGETSRVITGRDGRLCMVLSPGAILCVAPSTELTFDRLRVAADGLPQSESDLIRRIQITLHKGRILLHAGVPTPSLDLRVEVDAGAVRAEGGTFLVAALEAREWAVISEEYDVTLLPKNADPVGLRSGESARLGMGPGGHGSVTTDPALLESPLRMFELCTSLFQDLEPFIQDPLRFDRGGLSDYLGAGRSIEYLGYGGAVLDVSPSARPMGVVGGGQPAGGAAGAVTGGRWERERIWAWYASVGVIKGVNYVPRHAVNSTDIWQAETFDKDLIDEELGWAQAAGFTALRVQLPYAVWERDPAGFMERMETFLGIADRHGLKVVPVLFDDLNLAGREPQVGPQPAPLPGVHNAQWTPSPGAAMIRDRKTWEGLERYVKAIIEARKDDPRVLYWDLYNTAGNADLWEASLPLLDETFRWAREVNPEQPLAVAAWSRYGSAMSARKLERSDLITFHSFEDEKQVEGLVRLLKRHERPIVCSDWLMRQRGSQFSRLLPLFAQEGIGWFSRGLVRGKTQTWIQQPQVRSADAPEVWQHDLLEADGTAYDREEVELIKGFRYQERP